MKDIIRKNFERASHTYNQYDGVQKKSAFYLANKINSTCHNLNPSKTLDIGCGTGNLSQELYKVFPKSNYHLNDISAAMLKEAAKQLGNKTTPSLIHGDIEKISLQDNYDLIASNMCLQWANNMDVILNTLQRHTKILAFSCLLENSFKEWYELLEEHDIKHASRSYPSQKKIINLITNSNKNMLHASCTSFTVSFANAKDTAKYLRSLGANTPKSSNGNSEKTRNLLKSHDSPCKLIYNIGYFITKGAL